VKRTVPKRAFLAPAALAFLNACTFGPRLETFPPAHGPRGATAAVEASVGGVREGWVEVRGELLEVRADGLILLSAPWRDADAGPKAEGPRVVFVGYDVLREARFEAVGESLDGGETPGADTLEKMRRLSRFPQGLPPELLEKLLLDCGQAGLEVLRP
jgi:hypothetical protein